MNIRDWISVVVMSVGLIGSAGAGGKWLADQHYVTRDDARAQEIRELDREITFIDIKVSQGEATNSERIYVESLRQQLRALKDVP